MRPTLCVLALATFLAPGGAGAQTPAPSKGPIIADFGPVYAVPDPGLATPMLQELKLRFDVSETADDPKALSARLETAARFLNMHGKAGVSPERLKVAIVVHGTASKDVLSNDAYRKRHGIDNPNLPLLLALKKAGVRIYLCGQSAGSRGIAASEIAAPVEMALSAMTAHLVLNAEGYVLNPF
ncbi:MAG: DsrE family protein [Acidobacteria bacterium]|nr:DsrE family protein [Acidobacteriota bacterium]